MSRMPSYPILLLCVLLVPARTFSQESSPPKKDRRKEALRLYAEGALHEKKRRITKAIRAYEQAKQLDPNALPVLKALIPLYLLLDRKEEAFALCKKVLEKDPDDHVIGYRYARELRLLDRTASAIAVLEKVSQSKNLKNHPEIRLEVHLDLAHLYTREGKWKAAETESQKAITILENPEQLIQRGVLAGVEIKAKLGDCYQQMGEAALRAGRTTAAIKAFRQAAQKDPSTAPTLGYSLARALQKVGKRREALKELNTYLDTRPESLRGYRLKVDLLKELNRSSEVLGFLSRAAAKAPGNIPLQLMLAREYRKQGKSSLAEDVYQRILKMEAPETGPRGGLAPPLPPGARNAPSGRARGTGAAKTFEEVYLGLFGIYQQRPRADRRIFFAVDQAITKAVGKDGKDGDPKQAPHARAMLRALARQPGMSRQVLGVAMSRLKAGRDLSYATRYFLGDLAGRTGQLEYAEKLYRQCLSRTGRIGFAEHDVYAGLLDVLSRSAKHTEVLKICDQGLKRAALTNRVLFHRDKVRAYQALGRPEDALREAKVAVRVAGGRELLSTQLLLADTQARAGKQEVAIATCKALLKEYNQRGERHRIRLVLSMIYERGNQNALSLEELRKILKEDPEHKTALNNLGYQLAVHNQNLQEAERVVRKALELDRQERAKGGETQGGRGGPGNTLASLDLDQENAAFLDSLGWIQFRKGDLKKALTTLQQAVNLQDGRMDPLVWDHLGDVLFRLGRQGEARKAWTKAVVLYKKGFRPPTERRHQEIQEKLRLVPSE